MPRSNVNLKSLEKTLFFLTILFLPTQLGKHFWPEFSFVYSLRIDYLSPVIYFWDLLVLSLLIVWVFKRRLEKDKSPVSKQYIFLFLVFILTQAVSGFGAVNPQATLLRIEEYLITGLFGFYLASQNFLKIKTILFGGLILGVLLTCFLAVLQFVLGHSIGLWILGERTFSIVTPLIARFNYYENVFLRPYATFPHPNMLSAFLILTLPMILYGFSKRLRAFRLTSALLILSTIFLTFSRPGLGLALVQISILFRKFWKLLLIAGVILTPLVVVRFISVFTFDTLAVLRRQELSDYAIKLFIQHPLFGIGLNNFINLLGSEKVLVGTSRFLQPVHNIFLLISAETGLVGSIGFLAFLGTAVYKNLTSSFEFPKVLLGNIFIIIFLGFFDHYFLTLPQGQRMLFLILGLSFANYEVNNFSNTRGLKK